MLHGGELRYAITTPTTNLSLCNQINSYLTNSTGNSVSVQWILWAYWYDVCPFGSSYCPSAQVNTIIHYYSIILL